MKSVDIDFEIRQYLISIPEIVSCRINVTPFALFLNNINNTNLIISSYRDERTANQEILESNLSKLFEANIKQDLAMKIAQYLCIFYEEHHQPISTILRLDDVLLSSIYSTPIESGMEK